MLRRVGSDPLNWASLFCLTILGSVFLPWDMIRMSHGELLPHSGFRYPYGRAVLAISALLAIIVSLFSSGSRSRHRVQGGLVIIASLALLAFALWYQSNLFDRRLAIEVRYLPEPSTRMAYVPPGWGLYVLEFCSCALLLTGAWHASAAPAVPPIARQPASTQDVLTTTRRAA